jgi:polyisoprenoid-binding protein YceI
MAAMKALLALSLAAALGGPAVAQTLVPEGSEIRFVSRQMGVPVEGRFTRFTAQIRLDLQQPAASSVALAIDTRSIAFGAPDTEAEAAKPAWFASAQFPQAQFRSTAVKPAGSGRFDVEGTLTVKGIARTLQVPVTLAPGPAPGQGTASGSFTLRRMDFRLGEGEWADTGVVANEVAVRFRLQLAGLPPP